MKIITNRDLEQTIDFIEAIPHFNYVGRNKKFECPLCGGDACAMKSIDHQLSTMCFGCGIAVMLREPREDF